MATRHIFEAETSRAAVSDTVFPVRQVIDGPDLVACVILLHESCLQAEQSYKELS